MLGFSILLLVLNKSGSGSDFSQAFRIILCDVLVDKIFGYITVEKAGINFEVATEKIRLFFSILLLNGYHKLPDYKMYWEATPYNFVQASSEWDLNEQDLVRPLSIFLRIFIFVITNNLINKVNSQSSFQ